MYRGLIRILIIVFFIKINYILEFTDGILRIYKCKNLLLVGLVACFNNVKHS